MNYLHLQSGGKGVNGLYKGRNEVKCITVGFDGEDEHDGVVLMHRREDYCIFSTKKYLDF